MFRNLRAEMARYGVKPKHIAATLGYSRKTTGKRLNGKSDFTLSEMKKIRDKHFPHMTLDALFKWEEVEEKAS